MIFPLTGLLGETAACVCFSCSGTALACEVLLVQHYLVLRVPP